MRAPQATRIMPADSHQPPARVGLLTPSARSASLNSSWPGKLTTGPLKTTPSLLRTACCKFATCCAVCKLTKPVGECLLMFWASNSHPMLLLLLLFVLSNSCGRPLKIRRPKRSAMSVMPFSCGLELGSGGGALLPHASYYDCEFLEMLWRALCNLQDRRMPRLAAARTRLRSQPAATAAALHRHDDDELARANHRLRLLFLGSFLNERSLM
jgi:hypothetical protein